MNPANPFASLLLKMSDSEIDSKMRPYIEKWSDPPTALEVLEVLDWSINGSLASGFVVACLQALYDLRCSAEGTTHDDVVKLATWREPC
jgi:hypothetical protein